MFHIETSIVIKRRDCDPDRLISPKKPTSSSRLNDKSQLNPAQWRKKSSLIPSLLAESSGQIISAGSHFPLHFTNYVPLWNTNNFIRSFMKPIFAAFYFSSAQPES
jgi:hypothetical protein